MMKRFLLQAKQISTVALLAFMLMLSGIWPDSVMTSYATVSHSLSSQTAGFLKTVDIKTEDGNTYRFGRFSEDYVVYIFGRTGCSNTRSMMSATDKAQEAGISVRKVFLPVDAVDNGLYTFKQEHSRNLTCAAASKDNGTNAWACLRYEGLEGGVLPYVFVLDKSGSLVWASEAYEVSSYSSFWSSRSSGGNTVNNNTAGTNQSISNVVSLSYQVKYGQTEARSMLSMINEFRTGSNAWYWNSSDTQKIYKNNLQTIVYDYDLEKYAMERAAELALYYSHTKPDGTRGIDSYTGRSRGENIAVGYNSAAAVFVAWRESDEPYSGQGHRRNMLDEDYTAVGIGHAIVNGRHCWVQEFRSPTGSTMHTAANDSAGVFTVNALKEHVGAITINSTTREVNIRVNETQTVSDVSVEAQNKGLLEKGIKNPGSIPLYNTAPEVYIENTSIASISGNTVRGLKAGKTSIVYTITVAGQTAKKTIPVTVTAISDNSGNTNYNNNNNNNNNNSNNNSYTEKSTTQNGICYRIESGKAIVTGYTGSSGRTITIPSTISVNGISYPVTSIANKAFKWSYITKLSGGSNLKYIGTGSFAQCKSLATIELTSSNIISIGKNAFKGCSNVSAIRLNVNSLISVGKNAFRTGSWNRIDVGLAGDPSGISLARSMLITAGIPSTSFSTGTGNNGNNVNNSYTLKTGWYKTVVHNFNAYIQRHSGGTIVMQMERISDGAAGKEVVYTSIGNNEYKTDFGEGVTAKIVVESSTKFTWTAYDNGVMMLQREYVYR